MIGLGKIGRVFVSNRPADMRKAFHGLAALVLAEFGNDPLAGSVYLFVSRDAKRAKLIWYDGTGFCLFQKRLNRGKFATPWAHISEGAVVLSASQVAAFFEGSPLVFLSAPPIEIQPRALTTQIAPIQ